MCGIFGTAGKYDSGSGRRALDVIKHRGPDNTGAMEGENFFLGHLRLAIIDLKDSSNQPMTSSCGQIHIVFNGEIYNYLEIKEELSGFYEFSTDSDTEAVIAAYLCWGDDFIHRLNGMFAMGIMDERSGELKLWRDRFGKKPLYYTEYNGSLVFCSEIKGIISYMGRVPDVDRTALCQYFSFLATLAPNTMYQGIHKLDAGSFLTYRSGRTDIKKYYSLSERITLDKAADRDEACRNIEELLISSVNYRQIADVEVASFLSGGIDSSLLSALYARQSMGNISTFSIGYDEYRGAYDELSYAAKVAEHIGSRHHEYVVGRQDFLAVLDDVIWHLDEPVNDPACVPTYILAGKVKEAGIKAILSGEGSDEVFFGYDMYFDMMHYYRLQNLPADSKDFFHKYQAANFNFSKQWEHIRRAYGGEIIFRSLGESFTDIQKQRLFRDGVSDRFSQEQIQGMFDEKPLFSENPQAWLAYVDFRVWLCEAILMKLDKMNMAFSLESRAPFLDYRIFEYVLGLDGHLRMGGTNKNLLKRVAEKYIPNEIVHRRKKGFSSPYLEWYVQEYGQGLFDEIFAVNAETGYFDNDFLKFLHAQAHENKFRQHVWGLIVFSRWFKNTYM